MFVLLKVLVLLSMALISVVWVQSLVWSMFSLLKLEWAVLVRSLVVRFVRYLLMLFLLTMAFISIVRSLAVLVWSLVIKCVWNLLMFLLLNVE